MLEGLFYLWHMLPILLIFYVFGGGLLVRLTTNAATPPKDYSYQPKVSVLLPVYNEGAHVLDTINSILAADWQHDKLEIVAIDDCSADDSFQYLLQAQAQHPDRLRASKNPSNSGKHVTLTRALAQSTGEIVICIDSDCIFDKKVIRELVACFGDPKVGAVGGHVGITNVNDNVFTLCQAVIYFMSFQIGKMLQNVLGKLFCISGCLFAVRRHIFEEVEEEVRNRNWFGMKVRDGEDRFMTHAILMRGWKTILNPSAVCWTAAPAQMSQLFGQQVRWRRSGLRDLFWTLARLPQHFRIMGVRALFSAILPELFTVIWAMYLLTAIPVMGIGVAVDAVLTAFVTFCSAFMIAALAYNHCIKTIAVGSEPIRNPLAAGLAGAWFFMDSIIVTTLALCTFDVGSWGTRELPKSDTSPAAPAAEENQKDA
ncbi:glycosyltransferase [Achromobacter xylosoxidans]|uniref:glycosyltransferase n=1 Tax=Achromobacter anxifer TaxID=1287737 RepID=UPI00155CA139|nr:glycosyltransferase family 2 protein [Achromobacter anxifer]CAB5514714.1 Undecaprenyl-phosphate 4-deoxy-4-formamido-L-arabinose transferase [Achromobacter anxifer]